MPRYWDYSEKERAALTEEHVKALLAVEMMEKGVLDPGPSPKVDPPKPLDLPKKTYYRVKKNSYSSFDCLFTTMEAAGKFLALNPLEGGYDYQHGERSDYAKRPEELMVEAVASMDYEDVRRHSVELKRIAAQNEANKKLIEGHAEAVKKANAVTDGVWSDWQDCKAKGYSHARTMEVFDQYVKLADGNKATARKFLAKAYSESAINEAFEWCGRNAPQPAEAAWAGEIPAEGEKAPHSAITDACEAQDEARKAGIAF